MIRFVKVLTAFVFVAATANLAYAQSTSVVTADLAKKCREQAIKAHPTPKAGTKAQGVEKAQRELFQACLSKGAGNK
jgi:hypothetical protein